MSDDKNEIAPLLLPEDDIFEFSVPADFDLPEELIQPAPRPLPQSVKRRFARKRIVIQASLSITAAICLIIPHLDIAKHLGLYFIPILHTDMLAYLILSAQAICLLFSKELPDNLELYVHGTPIPARIDSITLQPHDAVVEYINGTNCDYAYYADITVRLPGAVYPVSLRVKSAPLVDKEWFKCKYKPGDFVPALYLSRNDGLQEINLYGFLEIDESSGVVLQKKNRSFSAYYLALAVFLPIIVFVIPGLVLLFQWACYILGRYFPIDNEPTFLVLPPFSGIVSGIFLTILWWFNSWRQRRKVKLANDRALKERETVEVSHDIWSWPGVKGRILRLILIPLVPVCCIFISYCVSLVFNSMLDYSKPEYKTVEIVDKKVETRFLMFRKYVIEYRFPGNPKVYSLQTTPEHLKSLGNAATAKAVIKRGNIGWKWIDKITLSKK
jgi:hypothetical protein